LVEKTGGKCPRARHKRRWQDNFNMDLQEVVWKDMGWLDLAQDRSRWPAIVSAVMKFWDS